MPPLLKMKSKKKGFTLIELMIVVAIIGILAAVAIPNFMKYLTKSKQAEAKANLKGIYTVELTYYSENGYYVTEFTGLAWEPLGPYRYAYNMGGATRGLPLPGPAGVAKNNDPPGAEPSTSPTASFTAVAWGNIDNDLAYDTWQINNENQLVNKYDDVVEELP